MWNKDALLKALRLEPLPGEGGFFRRTYECAEKLPSGKRCGSSIYFLLEVGNHSQWHRLQSDEIWFFHEGAPVTLRLISPAGEYRCLQLGRAPERGENFQYTVPAGYFQMANIDEKAAAEAGCDWALVSTAVFPEFLFEECEICSTPEMIALFPAIPPGRLAICERKA